MVNEGATDWTTPLVLVFDVGSSGTRGALFDAAGAAIPGMRGKMTHSFTTGADGTSVIDPDLVASEIEEITDQIVGRLPDGVQIAGVGLDTFASSLVGVDADGAATTPCYTYADTRCEPQVAQLREQVDEDEVHQRTGARQHSSYTPPRLLWLAKKSPRIFAATTHWLSLGEYVYLQLLGTTAVGSAAAAWSGMLDRFTGDWDEPMLQAARIDRNQLSPVHEPDQPIRASGAAQDALARRWPALAEAQWYPAIGDGLAANLGADASAPGVIGITAATSGALRTLVHGTPDHVPPGLWCYRVSATKNLLGGAVSDVGRVARWVEQVARVGGGPQNTAGPDALLAAEPEAATPLVLPFLSGERSTGWRGEAHAHMLNLTAATTAEQIYRGAMEATVLSLGRIEEQMRTVIAKPEKVIASGGVAKGVPHWCQILADVLGTEVVHVIHRRSTLRGTALYALEHLAPDVPRAPADVGATYQPDPSRAAYYADRMERFEEAYEALIAGPAGA